jgi:antitoxin FitA
MATLSIRNFDDQLKQQLRLEAAKHGCSMEEEVRQILRRHLLPTRKTGLGTRLQQRFVASGGVALQLPQRKLARSADLGSDDA